MKKYAFRFLICILATASFMLAVVGKSYHQSCLNNTSHFKEVCAIDTNEAYAIMWQKLFLTRDQISQEYYNNHIAVISVI